MTQDTAESAVEVHYKDPQTRGDLKNMKGLTVHVREESTQEKGLVASRVTDTELHPQDDRSIDAIRSITRTDFSRKPAEEGKTEFGRNDLTRSVTDAVVRDCFTLF